MYDFVLQACALYAQKHTNKLPYSHFIIKLYKLVLGSDPEMDAWSRLDNENDNDFSRRSQRSKSKWSPNRSPSRSPNRSPNRSRSDPIIIHLNQGHGQGQAQGQGQGAPKSMVRTIGYFLNLGTRDHISPRR